MKKFFYIAIICLSSCSKTADFSMENKAIFGLWVAGEVPIINAVLFDNENYQITNDDRFELVFPDGEIGSFTFTNASYALQSERLPQAGERVVLNWLRGSDTARVVVDFPPQAIITSIADDTLVYSENTGTLIEWLVPSSNAEFALQLECTEGQPIPLPLGPGNFGELFNGPQVSSQLQLNAEAFTFYGSHQLRISVLNDELLGLFFFDPSDIRGLLKNGLDNVIGGKGFVTAISTTNVPLEIE